MLLGLMSYAAIRHGPVPLWHMLTATVTYAITHRISRYHGQQYHGRYLEQFETVLLKLHDG